MTDNTSQYTDERPIWCVCLAGAIIALALGWMKGGKVIYQFTRGVINALEFRQIPFFGLRYLMILGKGDADRAFMLGFNIVAVIEGIIEIGAVIVLIDTLLVRLLS